MTLKLAQAGGAHILPFTWCNAGRAGPPSLATCCGPAGVAQERLRFYDLVEVDRAARSSRGIHQRQNFLRCCAARPFAPTKQFKIARQICAGLASSHDAGVLHRDSETGHHYDRRRR